MRFVRQMAAICVACLLPVGCHSLDVPEGAAPGVRVADLRAPEAGIRYDTVVVIDKSLQRWDGTTTATDSGNHVQQKHKYAKIAVESSNSRRTPSGTLEVWTVLRNRTDYPLQIEGRTHFFNTEQMESDVPTAWQRVHLPPQSVMTYRDFSTQVEGVDHYYIEIREGR